MADTGEDDRPGNPEPRSPSGEAQGPPGTEQPQTATTEPGSSRERETETGKETEKETETETGKETEKETETETETEKKTGTETETEVKTDSEAKAGSEAMAKAASDAGTETKTETKTETETETKADSAAEPKNKGKVDLLLKAAGDAPIMRQRLWKVDPTQKVTWVIQFISRYIKLTPEESLFVYVSQAFSPAPDQTIGNLLDCFGSEGKLVLHYCKTQAWG